MIKISIKLDTRKKLQNGKYPLKFTISRDTKTFYLPTGIELKKNEWDSTSGKVKALPNRFVLNTQISKRYQVITERLLNLQNEGKLRLLSDKRLAEILSNGEEEDIQRLLFKNVMTSFLALSKAKRTIEIYQTTVKKIQSFCDYDWLLITDITHEWLDNFILKLRHDGCVSANTRAIHLRNIRAVLNFAKRRKLLQDYVFDTYKIETTETRKRSLTLDELRKLHDAELPQPLSAYRDVFFLIFYLMGINLIDLSRLKKIQNGRIEYRRAKTGTLYSIKVEPEAMDIIERYKGEKHLLRFFDKYKNYNDYKRNFNENIHKICDRINIPRISSYWARHTFATLMYEIDIPIDIISDCLGHKSSQNRITQIYIKKNQSKNDIANRKLIDYVLYNKKGE